MAHDCQLGRSLGVALGGEAGPQRMTGERAVETDCERAALDNVSDGPVAQALRSEVAVTIDGA